jgi:hypothetical protein
MKSKNLKIIKPRIKFIKEKTPVQISSLRLAQGFRRIKLLEEKRELSVPDTFDLSFILIKFSFKYFLISFHF